LTLGAFAEMRLQTVREDAAVRLIWNAVARAPAYAVVAALPAPRSAPHAEGLPKSRAAHARPARRAFRMPQELQLAAAAAGMAEARVLETAEAGLRAWVYEEAGRMRLEIQGVGAGPLTAVLIAEHAQDGEELARAFIDV